MPAALEIIESPPAPHALTMILTLCACLGLGLVWASVATLDFTAVAWGKIESNGHAKVVQPFDTAKVISVAVTDGQTVYMGDVLVELDASEAQADAHATSDALATLRAEAARRRAALERSIAVKNHLARDYKEIIVVPVNITYPDDVPTHIAQRDCAKIINSTAPQYWHLSGEKLIATLESRVAMRTTSMKLEVGSRSNLLHAQEVLDRANTQLALDEGQLIETTAAIDEIASQKIKAMSQFTNDMQNKLKEALSKADDVAQTLTKAEVKLARSTLTAPIDGIV